MIRRLKILKAFIIKELKQTLRDPRMRIVLFIAPLIQLTIFGIALSFETKNIRIAMWGNPGDILVTDLMEKALDSGWFIPAKVNGNDPMEWLHTDSADAVIFTTETSLEGKETPNKNTINVLINAKNSVRAQAIDSYLKKISKNLYQTTETTNPEALKFDIRALYNPSFETAFFMVPGVMSMLVCLVTIILTSMAVAREKELGTIETLISSPIDIWDLTLGKTIPYIIIGCIQLPIILLFAVMFFNLPIRGPLYMLIFASVFMVAATVAIGLFISTIANNQQQAMFGGFMYLFPSYLLSGLMFPVDNMPQYIQVFSYINPLTHYMGLLRNILLIGGDMRYFINHILILNIIGFIIIFIAANRFKKILIANY